MHTLRVNKTKLTAENPFNRYHFGIEGKSASNSDKKSQALVISTNYSPVI